MIANNQNVGKVGEKIAVRYLLKQGYKILQRNFFSHWSEIDVVAEKDNKIFFIEIKTRKGKSHGYPYESINYYKLKSLKRAISYFLLKYKFRNYKLSIGVISIILNEDSTLNNLKFYPNIDWRW